jgi:hypothetical protein
MVGTSWVPLIPGWSILFGTYIGGRTSLRICAAQVSRRRDVFISATQTCGAPRLEEFSRGSLLPVYFLVLRVVSCAPDYNLFFHFSFLRPKFAFLSWTHECVEVAIFFHLPGEIRALHRFLRLRYVDKRAHAGWMRMNVVLLAIFRAHPSHFLHVLWRLRYSLFK